MSVLIHRGAGTTRREPSSFVFDGQMLELKTRAKATADKNRRKNDARPPRPATIVVARMNYWLIKQEPETYSWSDLVNDKKTAWTGVRNFQARNNLKSMKKGDVLCFYHSGKEKQIVGLATVAKEPYPDPTGEEGDWVCVDVAPVKPFQKPVTLSAIKGHKTLQGMLLVRQSRLSVMPLAKAEFEELLRLGETEV